MSMKFFLTLLFGIGTIAQSPASELVILLHGLSRTKNSMSKMEKELRKEGYDVLNIGYPSTKRPIESLADSILKTITPQIQAATKVHFVTHSMGGIITRYIIHHNRPQHLGRVVMLAPPNQGSEVVDNLGPNALFYWWNGPAGRQLGTDSNSLPNTLPPADFELGIIAGDRTINFYLSTLIPGKNDGKVAVQRTKLEGMKDFIIVHASHPLIMRKPETIKQVKAFLSNGLFERSK